MKEKKHLTVLLHESIKSLNIKKNGIYIDCTFGSGGHSIEILNQLGKKGRLYSIDRDPNTIQYAKKILDPRFIFINDKFSNIDYHSKKYKLCKKIDGIILDLGYSSMQIMDKNRGFSFHLNGRLDMRMNPLNGISAYEWINNSDKNSIANVLKKFGEEKFSKRIANEIEKKRKINPIITTKKLSEIIKNILPKKKQNKHPARRSFQAIRIFINQELYELKTILKKSLKILNNKGRIVIISFHSLEDRIVKKFINKNGKIPTIPMGIPITEKKIKKKYTTKLKIISRIFPNKQDIYNNPRCRSAILRTAEFKKNIK